LSAAPNRESALSSPYYEVFKTRKFEVLFHYEPWDEFVGENLHGLTGKTWCWRRSRPGDDRKILRALPDDQAEALAGWMKGAWETGNA